MGNSKSKRKKNEPKDFFGRMRRDNELKEQHKKDQIKKRADGSVEQSGAPVAGAAPARPPRIDPQPPSIPYDEEAIDRMRKQLKSNPTAFLLNNIMMSVQFLDNYERILSYLKNDSITETDRKLNDDMAQHQKHVFLPDKLQEIIDSHVRYFDRYPVQDKSEVSVRKLHSQGQGRKELEVFQSQRMYIIHDNIEVNEPGDVADYSTINNAPHYTFMMEGSEEPGFVKLRKLDVNRKINHDLSYNESPPSVDMKKLDNIESGAESDVSDISKDKAESDGMNFLNELKNKVNEPPKSAFKNGEVDINSNRIPTIDSRFASNEAGTSERRPSGILKPTSTAVKKATLTTNKSRPKKLKKKEEEDRNVISESESSGYKSSYSPQTTESDYGYATITAEATPRRLEMSQLAKPSDSTSEIPMRCISIIEVKRMRIEDDDDDEDSEDPYESRYGDFQRELYKKVHYLNSRIFTLTFSDLFQLKLAQSLGFNSDSLVNALTQGASIYCNINRGKHVNSFEILPAISLTWPSEAAEWMYRTRNLIRNPRTNYVYQWPTQDMIGKSRMLGCFAVPLGFVPTRGINPQQGLQWKLTFPTVERYLETCMAHSHVRCYIFSLVLFKKFIEIKSSNIGLNPSHLKNHLFWQMEDNYARWPEDRLGEVLILFLKSFYEHLMKSNMPYYFVRKCNLFKGIPKTVLLKQQKRIADILESPVMHLLSALRNIKYVKSDFYPVLNFKRLYRIITVEDTLRLINPNLPIEITNPSDDEDSEYKEKRGFWIDAKKEKNPEYHWKKQQQRQRIAQKAAEAIVTAQQTAPRDLIELKRKLPIFDQNRKILLLELFIPHFISIAETSMKFESYKQALMYFEHAKRLSVLLKDESISEARGREYIAMINGNIEELKILMQKPIVPQVPKRNSFVNSILPRESIRQKPSDQYVNLNSASQSEHQGNYRNGPESPTTKMAKVVFADVHVEVERPKPIRAVSFNRLDEESEDSDDSNDSNPEESRL